MMDGVLEIDMDENSGKKKKPEKHGSDTHLQQRREMEVVSMGIV